MTLHPTRDALSGYPCGFGDEWAGQSQCSEECPAVEMKRPCPLLPVYREHIKIRKALLGDMTPEEAVRCYMRVRYLSIFQGRQDDADHLSALADVVKAL